MDVSWLGRANCYDEISCSESNRFIFLN